MLRENQTTTIYGSGTSTRQGQAWKERMAVDLFVARVNSFGSLSQASRALQARLLEEVKRVARYIDAGAEAGKASGYDRRVLYEDPHRWSLAAIIMRPGQQTEMHDHGGWGCAVTVQGVERERRYIHDASDNLVLTGERNYPPGTGYLFDPADVHQPLGADPWQVTVALHFLVHDSSHHNAKPEVIDFSKQIFDNAA
jgi:predicted metal-dependent enzyme (double-stranded beta helix superfamily)